MSTLPDFYAMLFQLIRMPVAILSFNKNIHPKNIKETYYSYTKHHPRYKIIRHKTLGAALIDLKQIDTRDKYLTITNGRKGGASYAKRARTRGYRFLEIDRNQHVEAIHHINTSCAVRQGRPMDSGYQQKVEHFEALGNFQYFGVINDQGELVAYANLGLFGNFCGFSQLIGLRNNDGSMHLLLFEIVCLLIQRREVRYVMYDTFFGALPGLRQFKTMFGFRPYRAKYILL